MNLGLLIQHTARAFGLPAPLCGFSALHWDGNHASFSLLTLSLARWSVFDLDGRGCTMRISQIQRRAAVSSAQFDWRVRLYPGGRTTLADDLRLPVLPRGTSTTET